MSKYETAEKVRYTLKLFARWMINRRSATILDDWSQLTDSLLMLARDADVAELVKLRDALASIDLLDARQPGLKIKPRSDKIKRMIPPESWAFLDQMRQKYPRMTDSELLGEALTQAILADPPMAPWGDPSLADKISGSRH